VPDAATQRQTSYAGVAERSARRRETVPLSGCVDILPQRPSATGRGPRLRIDDDLTHETQVDDETPVADAMTGDPMAPSPDGHRQIGVACESKRRHDVRDVERPHNQLGAPLDHPVEGAPRDLEAAIVGSDDRPAMTLSQLSCRHAPTLRDLD
jgi:hypothetical protein